MAAGPQSDASGRPDLRRTAWQDAESPTPKHAHFGMTGRVAGGFAWLGMVQGEEDSLAVPVEVFAGEDLGAVGKQ